MKVTVTAPSRVDYKVKGGGAVSKAFALPTQEFEFNSQYVSSLGEAEGNPTAGRWKQGRSGAH